MFWIIDLLFPLRCFCCDPMHSGDDPDCPQHGWRMIGKRTAVYCALLFLLLLVMLLTKG